MNIIYLMKDEKRDYCLFKVGFTKDLEVRIRQYACHNAEVACISRVHTMEKSERNVEKMFHEEIAARGYSFVYATIDGRRTEWFRVPYTDSFYGELCAKGLNAFQCGKNRKDYGEYTTHKAEAKTSAYAKEEKLMRSYEEISDILTIDDIWYDKLNYWANEYTSGNAPKARFIYWCNKFGITEEEYWMWDAV